jgi:hypothetical protein
MKYTVEMGSDAMIYVPRFIKLVQAFKYHYGYYSNNLRGSDAGITDQKGLWSMSLK